MSPENETIWYLNKFIFKKSRGYHLWVFQERNSVPSIRTHNGKVRFYKSSFVCSIQCWIPVDVQLPLGFQQSPLCQGKGQKEALRGPLHLSAVGFSCSCRRADMKISLRGILSPVSNRRRIFYIWKIMGETTPIVSGNFLSAAVSEQVIVRDRESVKKISLCACFVLRLFPRSLCLAFVGDTVTGEGTPGSDRPSPLLWS